MSLIIKGLDMPKNCDECQLTNGVICYAILSDNEDDYVLDNLKSRHPLCPLIEIPTPHGRLIDADIVADMLDSMMVHKTLNNAFDEVLNMPTILEAEE